MTRRFDRYMYPYFKKDIEAGVYTRESALELTEDFFLSFNKDSDLYVGVQQRDNGQGGVWRADTGTAMYYPRGQVHTAIDTSGYASQENFRRVTELCGFVFMDLKLADAAGHRKYTGLDNARILENAEWRKRSGKLHIFRTPLIPDITDTEENLSDIERIVENSAWEKLPYNSLAGAKYGNVGREFTLKMRSDGE